MEYNKPNALVSTDWLEEHINDEDLRVVDATYHLPHDERDAYEEFTFRHIPGASYFPIDEIANTETLLPHMMPSADLFKEAVEKMGIGDDSRVVVYDSNGGYMAACRVWWMFRVFGHDRVSVLDGGLLKWGREKRAMEQGELIQPPATFRPMSSMSLVKSMDDVVASIDIGEYQIVDARSPGRFDGIDHEPRPTERRGHIPGSFNLPFVKLMNPKADFTFKTADEMADTFAAAGIDRDGLVMTTCGSGVTAAVVTFALYLLGSDIGAVYDGSWAEWGNAKDVPIGP